MSSAALPCPQEQAPKCLVEHIWFLQRNLQDLAQFWGLHCTVPAVGIWTLVWPIPEPSSPSPQYTSWPVTAEVPSPRRPPTGVPSQYKLQPGCPLQCPPDPREAQHLCHKKKEEDAYGSIACSSLCTAPSLQFSFPYAQIRTKQISKSTKQTFNRGMSCHRSFVTDTPNLCKQISWSPFHLLSERKSVSLLLPQHRSFVNYL